MCSLRSTLICLLIGGCSAFPLSADWKESSEQWTVQRSLDPAEKEAWYAYLWEVHAAADDGSHIAKQELRRLERGGFGWGPYDFHSPHKIMKRALENGDAHALSRYGSAVELGLYGFEKDLDLALELQEKAAAGGNLYSMNRLALRYLRGIGVGVDLEKALEYAERAGDARSHVLRGHIYRAMGDQEKALQAFEEGGEKGDADGFFMAGGIIRYVQKNPERAAGYFRKGAEQGDYRAHFALATYLLSKADVTEEEIDQSLVHLEAATRAPRGWIEPNLGKYLRAQKQRLEQNKQSLDAKSGNRMKPDTSPFERLHARDSARIEKLFQRIEADLKTEK